MKIIFEHWIEENVHRNSTKNLLNEAVLCYKSSANRAALLLSYISFIDIIKNRLLEANKPEQVTDGDWKQNKKLLLDVDQTDKITFDILNRADEKYFKLSDSIRTQIKYWKDRRNDCAHLKNNNIEAAHIEAFWLFIMDNLNKITVVGSEGDLLNRIKRHFDESLTPLGNDFTPLILDIPTSVEISAFNDFLVSVKEIIKQAEEDMWFYIGDSAKFFYCMLTKLNDEYAEIVKNFILLDKELSVEVFAHHPEFLFYYKKDNPQFIRKTWKDNIKNVPTAKIACSLLRNSIIPNEQIDEFIEDCAYQNNDNVPKEADFVFLIPYGYKK